MYINGAVKCINDTVHYNNMCINGVYIITYMYLCVCTVQ